MLTATFFLLWPLLSSTVAFKQPYNYLEALQSFSTANTDFSSILKNNESSPFAEDVVGRIDVLTTTLVGPELNTEYLLGLSGDDSTENSTQLLGIPASFRIQSAAIEPPVIAATLIIDFFYATVNLTVPLQIDLFINYDDHMKIQSYDAVIRRWDEYFTYVTTQLAPKISEELAQETSNLTELIVLRAATDVCQVATESCVGQDQQYDSLDACMSFMTTQVPFGESWEAGMNTGLCRYIHKNMVKYNPGVYCPQIGPSGGDMCISRDYVQFTTAVPFHNTLLAYNASFNAADMKNVPPANVLELVKIRTEEISMTTVAFYPIPAVLYMLFLYIAAKVIEKTLSRFSPQYCDISLENRRNTVTYVMNTCITTAALVLQLISSPCLIERYTFTGTNMLKAAGLMISGLYIFELTYRPTMRLPLVIHHLCTISAQVLLLSVLAKTGHPALIAAGEIWLFQATTEQSVFVGLILYRLKISEKWAREVLRFSAVQSFIFKLSFASYLLAFWAQHLRRNDSSPDDIALSVVLVMMLVLLMITQIYGTWAVWCLAAKINNGIRARDEMTLVTTTGPASSPRYPKTTSMSTTSTAVDVEPAVRVEPQDMEAMV